MIDRQKEVIDKKAFDGGRFATKINLRTQFLRSYKVGMNRYSPRGNPRSRFFLLCLLGMLAAAGCVNRGDLRFGPDLGVPKHRLSGTIVLPEVVESKLLGALRADILPITSFETFIVSAGGRQIRAGKDGSFSLADVPQADDIVIEAVSGKVALRRRVYSRDLQQHDLTRLTVDLDTTARALVWAEGKALKKDLTAWDINAREYAPALASLTTALRLALQLAPAQVPKTVLDVAMVRTPAQELGFRVESREVILREAHLVLANALTRDRPDLFAPYLSPQFGNDWDSSSSWTDFTGNLAASLKEYAVEAASFTILDLEFLPGSLARVRAAGELAYRHRISAIPGLTRVYVSDVIWRREGTLWKIHRNLPYRSEHPTQAGADTRWGEIAKAHADLQTAIFREDLTTLNALISPVFGNDWDANSTQADLLETARSRFNACDVKIATYAIQSIHFVTPDLATVKCRTQVRVIRLVPGIDLDSGPISATVTWRREEGIWKIYRNLPYRFSHPRNL
jgi:hypothetical protein